MNDTKTVPGQDLFPEKRATYPGAVPVGNKDHRDSARDSTTRTAFAGSAADIACRFHVGGRVHVTDHRGIRVPPFEDGKLTRGHHLRHGAAGIS